MREKLLDPTGASERGVDTTLAPRLRSLRRLTAGLLDNAKPNARLLSAAGWGKSDLRQFLFDHAVRTRAELAAAGKEAVSSRTRWRLSADHPDALPLAAEDGAVRALNSPAAVLVVVAGAGNAGVSAVVETFGPRGGPPPVTRVGFGGHDAPRQAAAPH